MIWYLFTAIGFPTGVLVGKLVQKLKTDNYIYKRRNNTQKYTKTENTKKGNKYTQQENKHKKNIKEHKSSN